MTATIWSVATGVASRQAMREVSMARVRNRLTNREVRAAQARRVPGMTNDGGGLYLRVRDSGRAEWLFRYKVSGRERWMPLSDASDMSLELARRRSRSLRVALDEGRDPLADRREATAKAHRQGKFGALAETWYSTEVKPRLKHPEAIRRALDRYLVRTLGTLAPDAVKPSDCARLLESVRAKYPTTANDLLRYMRAIFAFAIRRHLLGSSPVSAFTARLDAGGKEESRTRALSRDELVALFAAIRAEPSFGGDNLLLVRLLLALCVRKGELFGARWSEIDLDGKTSAGPVWRLPADRSKTGAPLDIPLVPQVVEWLRAAKIMAASSDWVLPARRRDPRARSEHVGRDTLNVAFSRIDRSKIEAFTVHDLRRTARTHLAGLGIAPHVAELCLNHKPKGVGAIYDRHSYLEERRAALQSWTNLLVQIEAGNTNVVPIRKSRRRI
jgi:integrase